MFIELDFNSNEAIYMQLRNQIILGIAQDQLEKVNLDMQMLVAEAICKDISLAEMHQIITDMYKEFGDIANGGNKET